MAGSLTMPRLRQTNTYGENRKAFRLLTTECTPMNGSSTDQDPHSLERIYKWAVENHGPKPGWPKHVAPLTLNGGDYLGFNLNNNLYFAGKRIEFKRRLTLTWWQIAIAAAGAAGTIGTAAAQWTRVILGI